MQIIEHVYDDYEQVVEFADDDFHCFIVIHSTRLGPALGGCRLKTYESTDAALQDCLRLAKGMTYKNSVAGLHYGGGKCVVMAEHSSREMMLKVGEAVNYFSGRYITAEDVGTTIDDILVIGDATAHTVKLDGSAMTARGVFAAMQAALAYQGEWGDCLASVPIYLEGLGKVGWHLATELYNHAEHTVPYQPNLFVNDLRQNVMHMAAVRFNAREIAEADKRFIAIYSPCAMGQVINAGNIDTIRYPIICGAANNQLTDDGYAERLRANGVLYCPDFAVNCGGVLAAAGELNGDSEADVMQRCDDIGVALRNIFEIADLANITTLAAANMLAKARLA